MTDHYTLAEQALIAASDGSRFDNNRRLVDAVVAVGHAILHTSEPPALTTEYLAAPIPERRVVSAAMLDTSDVGAWASFYLDVPAAFTTDQVLRNHEPTAPSSSVRVRVEGLLTNFTKWPPHVAPHVSIGLQHGDSVLVYNLARDADVTLGRDR